MRDSNTWNEGNTPPERAANADSIRSIPLEELPDSEARAELERRALVGRDVYAYIPAASHRFVVWVRQKRPDLDARFAPMDWARLWRAGLQPDESRADAEPDQGESDTPHAPAALTGEDELQRVRQRVARRWGWLTWLQPDGPARTG